MHTFIIRTNRDTMVVEYVIGFMESGHFRTIGVVTSEGEAFEWTSFLNGGAKPTGPLPQHYEGAVP